ncbi:MAG: hypothetical protein WBB74_08475 [Gaiellaceae bacterium]
MTTPPEQPPRNPSTFTINMPQARLPIPGNAEFFYVVLSLILVALLAWVAAGIRDTDWLEYFRWISVAYILSRGIAKASRVLEQ